MALIGKIRQNSWLLVILIGLGLFSFILMDMMSGQQSVFGSQQNFIGKVGNQKIDQNEFNRSESMMREFLYRGSNIDAYALKDQVWRYLTESKIVKNEADGLGLGVPKDEMKELVFGTNLSPIISQRFTNQETRQVDRNQLNQIKQQIEDGTIDTEQYAGFRSFWAYQEQEVLKQRLQDKMANMAAKAVYTPTWMVDMMNQDLNGTAKLSYVRVPYDDVDNSEVSLTDDDFATYFKSNSYKYTQDEETRKVDYISFDVVPSAADSAKIKADLASKIAQFQSGDTSADSAFVTNNYSVDRPGYFSAADIGETVGGDVFTAPIGTVIGPYVQGLEYRLTKVQDRVTMADSADTRHILISATTPESFVAAAAKIDSLKRVIESGAAKFADMATQFSQDPGSKDKGGLYESIPPNQFVPEYNKVLFITGQIGKLYSVRTSYGVHLVKVERRFGGQTERVRMATVGVPIIPSDETQRNKETEVYKIVQANRNIESLKAAVANMPGVTVSASPAFKQNDFNLGSLGQGQASRDIIRWAFGKDQGLGEPDLGEASPKFYAYQDQNLFYNNKYVLAALNAVIPEGTPSWKDLRSEIEPYVINSKKAAILKGKLSGADLNAMAAANNTTVQTADAVRFSGSAGGGLANETDVIAKAFAMDANAVSQPIEGNGGVFVVRVDSKAPAAAANAANIKRSAESNYKGRIRSSLVQALKKSVGVDDNRATFF